MYQTSQKAILRGISIARKYDAKLYVLHSISNPVEMMAVNVPGLFPEVNYTNFNDCQHEAKKQINKIIKKEISIGFPINELVSENDPVEEVEKIVREEKIDLIVMNAHVEGRFEHALFGGDNDAIVRRMPCSILLVKDEPEPVK
jgi:nucleotide-binding universal stress UspA family protein